MWQKNIKNAKLAKITSHFDCAEPGKVNWIACDDLSMFCSL